LFLSADVTTRPANLVTGLRAGNLEVRLASGEEEILASQRLRYRVFYEEMAAHPTPEMVAERRDFDCFDPHCDHLLVVDRSAGDDPEQYLVGTYRLIRRAAAARQGGFYTASEFDISGIESLPGEILELGRSCVAREHRNRPTMQLMWLGISAYVTHYDIGIMFGCASLAGTDISAVREQLSYLHHFHLAPESFRPRALADRYVDMNLIAKAEIDPRRALVSLPPLIKGYLRLGGFVGDGAVIDEQFNTIDVCIQVKTELVTEKYLRHYERQRRGSGGA
jgi:putative hemolysin